MKDHEKILQDEYGQGDEEPAYSDEPRDDLPDGMATIRLGGAEYSLFVAKVFCSDLPLLQQDEWSPEDAQRLSRLIAHLRTRRVVLVNGQAVREEFLRDLRIREKTCAELHRQRLQEGGAAEY